MAIKPLNSVAGFSVGEVPANIILSNGDITSNNANFTANVSTGNLLTDHLLYANGQPWDLQQAAGSNTQIQFNDGNGDFGASANLTFNSATNLLTVTGNANATGNISATYFLGNGSQLTGIDATSIQNGNSNVKVYANANVEISAVGNANVVTITGTGINVAGTLNATGNANVGNLGTGGLIVATGNVTGGNLTTGGVLDVTGNANVGNLGTAGLIVATGNIDGGNLNTGGVLSVTGNANVGNLGTAGLITATGNVTGGNLITTGNTNAGNLSVTTTGTIPNIVSANITTASNANLNIEPNGTGVVVIANTAGGATAIAMGDPTQGNLVSNAVTLSNSSSVSNAIAQLNLVLGKLVPPSPPNFPASQTIAIQSLSTYRMANYVQTDNTPGANKSVSGGTTVTSVRRASSYSTGNITVAGPGDSGTITAFLNGSDAGNRTLTGSLNGNGTYSNLVIYNNYDYNSANANITAGFWSVFSTRAAGTVTEGWNEVYIADSAASNSNTANWFYDSSAPGTPTFSSLGFSAPGSPSYVYSSTVPHYDNTNAFNVSFNVNKLSGNMYPTSDTFVTGTAGGAFGAPTSVTYSTAGITTPLAQNLYVSSGSAAVTTTSTIISGFGASATGPSVSVFNSYNTGTQAFTTTLNANVLYKTGTVSSASRIEEANVFVGSTIGSGSGLAFRIVNPGSGNTPAFTGSEAAFNSQSGTLQTYDATVVANVLKHDQTNYSTGYLPAGPNLSSGRTGTQYLTLKIVRTSVSKFDIKWTGTIAGLWVALPGSVIDTSSTINGWLDMSVAYAGAGVPGAGAGGNGSNGCALGGVAPLNSAQTNKSVTATFGTVSSSSTATNEIYIRIALTSGQSVTALSLQTASN